MPQSLKEVLKEKSIFERLSGKTPTEKLKALVSIAVTLTRGVLFEREKISSEGASQQEKPPVKK